MARCSACATTRSARARSPALSAVRTSQAAPTGSSRRRRASTATSSYRSPCCSSTRSGPPSASATLASASRRLLTAHGGQTMSEPRRSRCATASDSSEPIRATSARTVRAEDRIQDGPSSVARSMAACADADASSGLPAARLIRAATTAGAADHSLWAPVVTSSFAASTSSAASSRSPSVVSIHASKSRWRERPRWGWPPVELRHGGSNQRQGVGHAAIPPGDECPGPPAPRKELVSARASRQDQLHVPARSLRVVERQHGTQQPDVGESVEGRSGAAGSNATD